MKLGPSSGLDGTSPRPISSATTPSAPWAIIAAAIVVQAMSAPGQTVGISVFVDHFVTGLDVTRSEVAAAYLVGTLVGATTLPWAGRVIDRHGSRRAVRLFGIAFAGALAAMAGVTGLVTLTIGFVATRALGQGALTLTSSTSILVGFNRRRGTAVGLTSAAGGAAMSLVPFVSAGLVAVVGWRQAWLVLATVVGVVLVGLSASRVLPGVPEDSAADSATSRRAAAASWSVGDAVRSVPFWIVTGASSLSALVATGLMFHQIDLLGERGLSATQAAANFLPQTVAGAGAALLAGRLADRLAPGLLLPLAIAPLVAAPLLLQQVSPGATAVLYGVLLGVGGSSIRSVEATVLPRWFGTGQIGQIRGVVMAVSVAASATGPLALALAADRFGGYRPVLNGFALAAAAMTVLGAFARSPRQADRAGLPASSTLRASST